jgi:FkbM family methyltransferase
MVANVWNPIFGLTEKYKAIRKELAEIKLEVQRRSVYLGDHTVLTKLYTGHKIFLDSRDLSIAVHLMQDGKWETWVEQVITWQLKPGMTFCDVGANFGYYTLIGAQCVWPSGKVYSVECNPRLLDLLSRSILANGFEQIVKLIPVAASNESGEIEFAFDDKFSGGGSSVIPELMTQGSHQKIRVQSARLDDLIPRETTVSVLKIDVEGWESNVFDGAERILSSDALRSIIFEFTADSVARFRPPQEFLRKLTSLGFKLQILDETGLQPPGNEWEILSAAGNRLVYVLASRPGAA